MSEEPAIDAFTWNLLDEQWGRYLEACHRTKEQPTLDEWRVWAGHAAHSVREWQCQMIAYGLGWLFDLDDDGYESVLEDLNVVRLFAEFAVAQGVASFARAWADARRAWERLRGVEWVYWTIVNGMFELYTLPKGADVAFFESDRAKWRPLVSPESGQLTLY